MSEESRYVLHDSHMVGGYSVMDMENEMPLILFQSREQAEEFLNHLQQQEKQIKAGAEQLNYIQNSITNAIKNQKTKIGEKALRDVIEDYNEWMLGHKEEIR